jgi:hypothetical protein
MIIVAVPETKLKTLEELDQVFSIPTRRFAKYQVFTVIPWWFKRHVFRNKDISCPELYHDDIADDTKRIVQGAA